MVEYEMRVKFKAPGGLDGEVVGELVRDMFKNMSYNLYTDKVHHVDKDSAELNGLMCCTYGRWVNVLDFKEGAGS